LTISAALGVRDNNEAFGTQVLEVLEFMSDATTSPMLVDGDTGYVNDEAVSVRGIRRDLNVHKVEGE
jgi:2-methylisocitrate lyase-like PEP mutase family enzyme